MRHLVYCWEMGEGLGHIMALAKLVATMIAQGNRVTCILKDLSHAPRLLGPLKINWLAAPRISSPGRLTMPLNHADILYNCGYGNPDSVTALLVAWRTMFFLLRPDRIICDYAPTARLAAASLHIETICIDNGFSMPPLPRDPKEPLPLVRTTAPPDKSHLQASEQRVLLVVNKSLTTIGAQPISEFSSIFRGKVWYRNWCVLNHFAPHSPEQHLGQIFGDNGGADPVWPDKKGPKIFAYLKPRHPDSVSVLNALLRQGHNVLAYLPGFRKETLDELSRMGNLTVSSIPFDLSKLPDDIDAGVWHSPTGAVARCLDRGMGMVFLPMHPEQYLACMAVRRAGLPAFVSTKPENWPEVFDLVRSWPRARLDDRWQTADIPGFASKLAIA